MEGRGDPRACPAGLYITIMIYPVGLVATIAGCPAVWETVLGLLGRRRLSYGAGDCCVGQETALGNYPLGQETALGNCPVGWETTLGNQSARHLAA